MKMNTFNLSFKWVGCATWILSIDNVKISSDPVLCPKGTVQHYQFGFKSIRRTEPMFCDDEFKDIDIWLISHNHKDHIDKEGLAVIDPKSTIITNRNTMKTLRTINPEKVFPIAWGQTYNYMKEDVSIEIEAIPAVHASNPIVAVISGSVNGYWLTIAKGQFRIHCYVTGDTTDNKKVINALSNRKADVLIPHMGAAYKDSFGGPLTLCAESLKTIVNTIHPDLILPVHYGTFSHLLDEPISAVENLNDNKVKVLNEGQTHNFSISPPL